MRTKVTDRRNFFRRVGQLTLLSSLLGGTTYLASQDRVQLTGCSVNQFCKGCNKLNTCSLDQAKNERAK